MSGACLSHRCEAKDQDGSAASTSGAPKTQKELAQKLYKDGVARTSAVRSVLERVDRANYARSRWTLGFSPYHDGAQSIGHGTTISAPHMHAYSIITEVRPV